MSIRIKMAETSLERDLCFKLRHKVFVEEDAKFQPSPDGRMIDRFDTYHSTYIFMAYIDNQIVGTVRLNKDDPDLGFPADGYYDFRNNLPPDATSLVSVGMLCVDSSNRGSLKIIYNLLMVIVYWSIANDMSHAVIPINPRLKTLMRRMGFKTLEEGDGIVKALHGGLDIIPMILRFKEVSDRFLTFVDHQNVGQFIENFHREFYHKGERIISAGDTANDAYFLVEGSVQVSRGDGDDEKALATIEEGEIFGEIGLLCNVKRTAHVTAKTNVVVMRIGHTTLCQEMTRGPEHAKALLNMVGSRFAQILEQF
ncbi:N-acyl amino acid synthase FeeM domain-containing protein [Magnetococcales bacterium HHB-1]